MNKKTYLFPCLIASVLMLVGFGCKGGDPVAQEAASKPVILTWWRTQGTENDTKSLINIYRASRSNVNVQVRLVRPEELEQQLLEALASGRGPDIVSLPNTLLTSWQERLSPLPASITIPAQEYSGTIKRELKWVMKTVPAMTIGELRSTYVDTVPDDSVIKGQVYGLPLSLDSLMMFYNIDLLNGIQLPEAPKTWTEFKDASQKLTKLDQRGALIQDGVAMGEADNITYSADVLAALMLQNGTRMTIGDGTRTSFSEPVSVNRQTYTPGADALRFYTDFANPTKETYSWSADEPLDQQAFASGKVGFIFGYWRDYAALKTRAPKIRIGVARFPQIDNVGAPTYLANYSLETVTKQSKNADQAWDFLQFISKPDIIAPYLEATGQLTAHRSLITKQLSNLDLNSPSGQILTSKTWYHGYEPAQMEGAFKTMIRQVNQGTKLEEALIFAARTIDKTLKPSIQQ